MPRMWSSIFEFALALLAALPGTSVATTFDQGMGQPVTAASAGCALCIEANPLLIADQNGAASGIVRVCNRTSEDTPISLTLGGFVPSVPEASNKQVLYPIVTSTRMTVSDETLRSEIAPGAPLKAGRCAGVQLSVSGLSLPGLHSADLRNDRSVIGTVTAVRHLVPFNLKIDGASSDKAEVVVSRVNPSRGFIRVRNDDPMGYRFRWRIEMENWGDGGVASVLPHQYVQIPVNLPESQFDFFESGFLTTGTRNGFVLLTHEPDPSLSAFPLPPKRYPLTARLQYFGEPAQRASNTGWVLAFLLIGIALSLLVNYVLPTQRKRVEIKQQLADLEGRLGGLGEVVDSRTLSILRAEKKQLRDLLRALSPWLPSTEEALPGLKSRIEGLSKRIDLAAGAGDALLKLLAERDLAEFEKRTIVERCRAVLQVSAHHAPSQKELEIASENLQAAKKEIEAADEKPPKELIEALLARAKRLQEPAGAVDSPDPIIDALKTVLGKLRPQLSRDEYDPSREEFVRDAVAVRKAELVARYLDIVRSSSDGTIRKARLERGNALKDALSPGPEESSQRAEEIVGEVEENIYKEDIAEDLASGKTRIEVDPPTPLPYQLVTLRIALPRAGNNASAARREFKCRWTVDGAPSDSDNWTLVTYFEPITVPLRARLAAFASRQPPPAPRRIPVTITIADKDRTTDIPFSGIKLESTKEYIRSQTWLSLGTLGVTFLIVAIGLLTIAQEKLQSVHWLTGLVAVVALGFGADVLKKLIARP